MAAMPPSANATEQARVPTQREQPHASTPAELAAEGLRAVDRLTPRVDAAVASIDAVAMFAPCGLPGWTRAHLVSHLARNADALVNLLHWARTGIEQPAYASDEDRDADIAEGAERLPQVIQEDYIAAAGRFRVAADAMPPAAWSGTVTNRQGAELGGYLVPWMRATELLVHLVDLDVGTDFTDLTELPADLLEQVLGYIVQTYSVVDGAPPMRVRAAARVYTIGENTPAYEVQGEPAALIGWLTGRTDGAELTGTVPELPNWLK